MIRVRVILGEKVKNEFAFLGCQHLFLILFSCFSVISGIKQFLHLVSHTSDFSCTLAVQNLKTGCLLCTCSFG